MLYRVGAQARIPAPASDGYATALLYRAECLRALLRLETGEDRLESIESLVSLLSAPGVAAIPAFSSLGSESSLAALRSSRTVALAELGRFDEIEGGLSAWLSGRQLDADIVRAFERVPETAFDGPARLSLAWRSKVFAREYQSAWLLAEESIDGREWPAGRFVLSDLGKAALYGAPDPASLSPVFEREASVRAGDERYMLYFYAARLAWRSGTPYGNETADARGARLMANARDAASEASDRDAAIWYLIDRAAAKNPDALIAEIAKESPLWADPSWYEDILAGAISPLVASRDWSRLEALRSALGGRGPAGIEARLGYLAARTGALKAEAARLELERIGKSPLYPTYYRLLAADALGIPFEHPDDFASTLAGSRNAADDGTIAGVLRAMVAWKLGKRVYPSVREWGIAPSPPEATAIAEALDSAGLHSDALRLMMTSLSVSGYGASLTDLFAAYPRPWATEVADAAVESSVSEPLLYALIRSESFFDPNIASSAGAIGLTQLMESTAADVARKARLESYDLRDPATNIALGASYLGQLLARLDGNALDAVFSYNAGISRVREWRKTLGNLDDDLFLEAIPYAETREYGRKVLVATVLYGYLYYRLPADQSVRLIFRSKGNLK